MTFQGFQQSFIRKEGHYWQIITTETSGKEMVLGELDARLLQADQLPIGKDLSPPGCTVGWAHRSKNIAERPKPTITAVGPH